MGFFDFLKKKGPSHDEKVEMAYRCYKADMVGMIFPGGKKQASKIICSLAKVYNLNIEVCDSKMYYNILKTYSDVLIRRVVTQSSDAQIVTSLQVNHGDIIKTSSMSRKALAYVTINMKNNDFALENNDDFELLNVFAETYAANEKAVSDNAQAETQNLDDPEYGLVPKKPIYTQGVGGSKQYLSRLKTSLGEEITWNRRGSISMVGINGMIDIYDSTLPSGKPYKTIYINMYGSSNSQKLPKGFKL